MMKFESFAASIRGDSNGTNQKNYFVNGLCKEAISEDESFDRAVSYGKKDLFAVADGSKSAAFGEEAAFLSVSALREILGMNFNVLYENYFEARGEVYLPKHVLKELNEQNQNFMNTRNTASGALRNLDPKITKSRKLSA